ncbi:hypothetical protein MMC17_005946, partial [Xylographa soralifera]|nr:hypothetical protein [Xylographa soralifera]
MAFQTKDSKVRQQSQMETISYVSDYLIEREEAREWREASCLASGHQREAARAVATWESVITVAISMDKQIWFMMSK